MSDNPDHYTKAELDALPTKHTLGELLELRQWLTKQIEIEASTLERGRIIDYFDRRASHTQKLIDQAIGYEEQT